MHTAPWPWCGWIFHQFCPTVTSEVASMTDDWHTNPSLRYGEQSAQTDSAHNIILIYERKILLLLLSRTNVTIRCDKFKWMQSWIKHTDDRESDRCTNTKLFTHCKIIKSYQIAFKFLHIKFWILKEYYMHIYCMYIVWMFQYLLILLSFFLLNNLTSPAAFMKYSK